MVAVVPGFTYRQIPTNFETEHWDWSNGLILHVATGPANASLFGWFSNPAAEASSHWWVGANGTAEQYLDPLEHISYAQSAGNDSYHSVETGGDPEQPLSDLQMHAVARIYAWGHRTFGWPLQLAERPGDKGLGWHGMGGGAWGGHTGCPGDLRKAQRPQILAMAQTLIGGTRRSAASTASTPEEDMPLTPADLSAITAAVWKSVPVDAALNPHNYDAQSILLGTNLAAWQASGKLDKLDVDALASALAGKLAGQIRPDVDEQALAHDLVGTMVSMITGRK